MMNLSTPSSILQALSSTTSSTTFLNLPAAVARRTDLTPSAKLAYSALNGHARRRKRDVCRIRQDTLCQEIGASLNTVKRALHQLRGSPGPDGIPTTSPLIVTVRTGRSSYYRLLPLPLEDPKQATESHPEPSESPNPIDRDDPPPMAIEAPESAVQADKTISPDVQNELSLLKEPLIAKKAKQNLKTSTGGASPRPLPMLAKAEKIDTREELAKEAGVSHDTIHKAKGASQDAPGSTTGTDTTDNPQADEEQQDVDEAPADTSAATVDSSDLQEDGSPDRRGTIGQFDPIHIGEGEQGRKHKVKLIDPMPGIAGSQNVDKIGFERLDTHEGKVLIRLLSLLGFDWHVEDPSLSPQHRQNRQRCNRRLVASFVGRFDLSGLQYLLDKAENTGLTNGAGCLRQMLSGQLYPTELRKLRGVAA